MNHTYPKLRFIRFQNPDLPGLGNDTTSPASVTMQSYIRPLSKIAPEDELGGNWRAEERSELECNEAPSTSIPSQIASGVEFRKRSIDFVTNQFEKQKEPVTLVGHSLAGNILSQINSPNIKKLVYVLETFHSPFFSDPYGLANILIKEC